MTVSASPDSGRLAPIAALVEAARSDSPNLGALIEETLPAPFKLDGAEAARMMVAASGSSPGTSAFGGAGTGVVWHDTALFVVNSEQQPTVRVGGAPPSQMTLAAGTTYWTRLASVSPGLLQPYRFEAGGRCIGLGEIAGYTVRSYEAPGVKRGTLSEKRSVTSNVYPGAVTEYWLYVNDGFDETRGAPVMVWHDGSVCLTPFDEMLLRMQVVTDNLVDAGSIPPMAHVLVSPSTSGETLPLRFDGEEQSNAMRSLQYDTPSDRYGRHLLSEVLHDAGTVLKLRGDGYSRGTAGASSGGICAFTLGWFYPDQFTRVHSTIGSFTGLQWDPDRGLDGGFILPNLVRRDAKRNIRVWMSEGSNDIEVDEGGRRDLFVAGSWPLNNIQLANALKLAGYDFHFRFGEGHHTLAQAALDLPESLAWLWRDYDPDRTEQTFTQEESERQKPLFRVKIANRDSS